MCCKKLRRKIYRITFSKIILATPTQSGIIFMASFLLFVFIAIGVSAPSNPQNRPIFTPLALSLRL
jgi:hypothetical protein